MYAKGFLVAVVISAASIIPTQAAATTLRIVANGTTVFGATAPNVGSARAYIDTTGVARKLAAKTALGQLVAATSYTGLSYTAVHFEGLGEQITSIGGVKAPSGGYWEVFVNGRPAMVGASSLKLKTADTVVWLLDNDYKLSNGPFVFELAAKRNADGTTTFTGTRIGAARPTPAAGAALSGFGVAGAVLDAQGQVTLPGLPAGWQATIAATAGTSASQILGG